MFCPDEANPSGMETRFIRSRPARAAAERALVRIIHHYGKRPEFVVLGGLVPEWLCSDSEFQHAGTVDVDVQVDLEIACGEVNALRLERALRNAEFFPKGDQVWCWVSNQPGSSNIVKLELLADLQDRPANTAFVLKGCSDLGAVNLRGTGFASRDTEVRELKARISGVMHHVEVNVTGLAGFLLAKVEAAFSRRGNKDWYDIAFVLLHNNAGGPLEVAELAKKRFGDEINAVYSALDDLEENFSVPDAQGSKAYAEQMRVDHPDLDAKVLKADAVVAVGEFCRILRASTL